MQLSEYLNLLATSPQSIKFVDTLAVIDASYSFTPTEFNNGDVLNQADQNSGSCKVFAFGLIHQLSEAQTLACFGENYWVDVVANPDADNHANIRNFMKTGWSGINFADSSKVLKPL